MTAYLGVTEAAAVALMRRGLQGPVVMLNLLRFRDVADYAASPGIAPPGRISGEAAYRLNMDHTRPFLEASGGSVLFYGCGGPFLIGPEGRGWDAALLVRQASVAAFLAFAQDPAVMAGAGHRTAALADSRLLPLVPDAA